MMNCLVFAQDTTLTVTSTGNVGIGTTTPSMPLEIQGPGNTFEDLGMEFENTTSGQRFVLYNDGTSGSESFNIAQPLEAPSLTILATGNPGNVGIGTTTPGQKLSVAGIIESTLGGFKFPDGTVQSSAAGGGGGSVWSNSGLNIFYNSGNVGIGTENPEAHLEVHGLGGSGKNGRVQASAGDVKAIFDARDEGTTKELGQLGTITNHDFAFYTNNSERMRILNSGNVGIGTVIPEAYLEVHGLGGYGKNGRVQTSAGDVKAFFDARDEGTIKELGQLGTKTNHDFAFYTNDSERMRITNDGNLGIGTAAPTVPLEIQGPGNDYQDLVMEFENTTSGQRFVLYNDGTSGSESFKIAQPYESASLTILAAGSPGNVGIGTSSPLYKLHVNGDAAGTSWTNLSSRDYKENITRVNANEHQKMLKELIEVDISTYRYKEEFGGDGTTKLGFIAEEMPKQVLSKDGKGVDVYALLAYTIGALKAQQKKIEELEARLNTK
jgi:hypothetical protein